MTSGTDYLFRPIRIGRLRLDNRIVAPPMVQRRPITSAEGIAWYRRLAAGGAGMVIVESTGVPTFAEDLTVDGLKRLVAAIHHEGAAAGIQLFPTPPSVSASVNDLSSAELEQILEGYERAARICLRAGFDAVEPHGAHGFLLNRFFMPDENRRADEYGGSLENRCRLARRIVEKVRRAVADGLLIFYRHTPVGESYTMEESLRLVEQLVGAGLDALDVSPARGERVAELAEPFTGRYGVPVVAVGGMEDAGAAACALREGRCDMIAVGRQLIADAEWPLKVRKGRTHGILRCTKCDEGCFGNLRAGRPVECVLWDQDEVDGFVR